ncbi:MAG: efflux RND transporter periplasmic adaptor subunit [Planctomycetota bacterium]
MNVLRLLLQILLPVALLGGGAGVAYRIVSSKKQPRVEQRQNPGPLVRVRTLVPSDEQLDVRARGTVEPLRTVELAAEVSGRIVGTHEALRAGGRFTPNDVLVSIDPKDYQLAISQQEAAVARAELRLMQEEAEAEAALRAWQNLEGDRPADPLVRREPQIKDARMALQAAQAMLERSRMDLARCKVQLPFSGRVRSVHADIGQTVQRGQRLAVVLDTHELEVRLPIPLDQAGFAALPLGEGDADGPEVELTADFAGEPRTWRGRIVRVEGELDRRTRQLTAVARVRPNGDDPLLVGMFVEAVIRGRRAEGVYAVPRAALAEDDMLWLVVDHVDENGVTRQRLVRRRVDVLRTERTRALIRAGVAQGERVCLSTLQAPVDGMLVRAEEDGGGGEERAR